MNIACDARALAGPRTGVGTWTVHVMKGLARTEGWRVELLAPGPIDPPGPLREAGVSVPAPPPVRLPGSLWLQWLVPGLLRRLGSDLLVAPLGTAPRRCPVPFILVVHDLTPRLLPHRHTLKNRFCFNAWLEDSVHGAAAVVTPSEATREALLAVVPRAADRIRVIGEGADPRFSPEAAPGEAERIRERYAGGRAYILHLGTLEPRKGLPDLVAAWERLASEDPGAPDLVLAGGPGWGTGPILERIARSFLRDRIHLPGYVPDADAPALLRSAELFVLASESEGFGLPLAEALCCGTPCVITRAPALLEVAAGAAHTVPVHDPEALAEGLRAALVPEERERLRRAALERAPALGWEPAVEAWRALVREVVIVPAP